MKYSKLSIAIGLLSGLLYGCNGDGLVVGDTGDSTVDVTLTSGMWQLGDSDSDPGLPNVYVFSDDGNHKYYDDDEDVTAGYVIKDASVSTVSAFNSSSGTVSFKFYDATGLESNATDISDAAFTINTDGSLTIVSDDLSEALSSNDQTNVDGVKQAVADANSDSGINGYVRVLDTNHGGTKTDVGELRLKLSDSATAATVDSILRGKVSVKLVYQVDESTEQPENGNGNNAYVSLYSSGTSNTNLHGEIILNNGDIYYRSTETDSSGKPQVSEQPVGTYELGQDLFVELNWSDGYYTFSINEDTYDNNGNGFEAFDKTAVQIIALKLGDTSNTTHYELLIDDFTVYSHDSMDDEVVFSDTFDTYTNGQDLSGNPYNNNSAEAIVVLDGNSPGNPTDPVDNQVAAITDTDTTDTGELRYKFDEGMTTGLHKVSMFYSVGETESAYVSLFDEKNSTSSLIGELRLDEGKITLRGEDEQVATFTPGTWVDLEMSWDTSSESEPGNYWVKIDGVEYGPYTSQNSGYGVPVTATTIKFSSNSGTAETTLYVDDYQVYSDIEGTVEVFNDDFESYDIGYELNVSPYNSSTFSAVVSTDPLSSE